MSRPGEPHLPYLEPPRRPVQNAVSSSLPFVLATTAIPAVTQELELRWNPPAGAGLALELVLEQAVDGGELEIEMNGQPVPSSFLPELTLSFEDELRLVVHEHFEGEGVWLRRYVEASHTNVGRFTAEMPGAEAEEDPWDAGGPSPLEGLLLELAAGPLPELAAEVLAGDEPPEGLRLDLSFAGLLPEGPVEPGERWEPEPAVAALLLAPAGELDIDFGAVAGRHLFPEFDGRTREAELALTLRAVGDGQATIDVEGSALEITVAPGDLTPVPVVDGEATDTTTARVELEGQLVWDTRDHRLAELHLEGSLEIETLTVRHEDQPGPTYSSRFTAGGHWSLSASCYEVEEAAALVEAAAAAR